MEATNIPLNGQSATLPADLFTGMMRYENGKQYILVKNVGADLADGKTCKKDANATTDIQVIVGAAIGDAVIGVNNTGASITNGNYFWALQRGRGYTIGSTIAINTFAAAGAAGVVAAAAAAGATSLGVCIVANSEIFWNIPGGFGA